jgi:S1-C subfamily serine protease
MIIPVGGDIVVAFDGKKVTSSEELIKYLREEEPGDVVELKILRNHQFKRINVKLGERPQR